MMTKGVIRMGRFTAVAAAALLLLAGTAGVARAAGGEGVVLLDAKVDVSDRASLQRGAKLFINYCASCHSAEFLRYGRMGRDLGLTEEQLRANLMPAGGRPGDPIMSAVSDEDAAAWFGIAPPDLSLTTRSRGADWLYTYLMAFYRDDSRPFGVNNLVFPDVAMPHVLVELQGVQELKAMEGGAAHGADGAAGRPGDLLELTQPGALGVAEYRRVSRDLVNFMVYLGEPAKLSRYTIGGWVLVFLLVFFWISRLLYKEYWKDVH